MDLNLHLYAITPDDLETTALLAAVEAALRGGVTCLQLRRKSLNDADFIEEAKALKTLCRKYDVPLILNDRVELVEACGADGVHIGQQDMSAAVARQKLACGKILGVSARTVEQAIQAERDGADYLGSGAVFQTSTKLDAKALPREVLEEICRSVAIPVVAIGGITQENALQLAETGVAGIAVVSAIFSQPNVQQAAEQLARWRG